MARSHERHTADLPEIWSWLRSVRTVQACSHSIESHVLKDFFYFGCLSTYALPSDARETYRRPVINSGSDSQTHVERERTH
jgi:hypothetical protein